MAESEQTQLAVLRSDMKYVRKEIDNITSTLKSGYVTQDKFDALEKRTRLLERILFGLVAIMLIAVLGQILNGVFAK